MINYMILNYFLIPDIFDLNTKKGVRFNEWLKPKLDPISVTLAFVFIMCFIYIKHMYSVHRIKK